MASAQNANSNPYMCYENECGEKFRDALIATSHLQSTHKRKNGDLLHCMKHQQAHMFCRTTFKSFKALRAHMKADKCKLSSRDVMTNDANCESSCDEWNRLVEGFGSLAVEKERASYSLASYIECFVDKLIASSIPHSMQSDIISYTKNIVSKTAEMIKESLNNNSSKANAESILETTENFVISNLMKFDTRFKRKKHYMNGPHYVAPRTIPLGDGANFQYVSILETLKKLFKSKEFRDAYFSYNNAHECKDNVYERFCCGQNYKKGNFFQLNKNNIQIQIYFDDVQLTSPLKTSGHHKVCAVYFFVRNIPPQFTSKLDNIYLLALCDSNIVDSYGCNSIFKHIVDEIKILETEGLSINCDENDKFENLKGTLVQMSFDNLGGNTIFGYTKCFNATYFCRICICTNVECQKTTIELACKIRTKEQLREQIEKRLNYVGSKKLEAKDTLGVVKYCVLNDLNFYHTIDNRSQDIMHDLYEGAIPFILTCFFGHLIDENIINEQEIEQKIGAYDYGRLERRNIPRKFCFRKKNLNQNASQMACLMKNIPFIFVNLLRHNDEKKRSVVHKAWPIIEYILKISQITSSNVITEDNLINLEKYTHEFLSLIQDKFEKNLIPKLHFMVHYPNTIRILGPLKKIEMMRGDAKHQQLTQYAKRCRNYMNITKTLSEKHQEVLSVKWSKNTYCDSLEVSKKGLKIVSKKGQLIKEVANHSKFLSNHFEDINQLIYIKYIVLNSSTFARGLFIIVSNQMHQIEAILKHNDSFIFLCRKFTTVKYFDFANCFEIQESEEISLINFDTLACKRTYEAKFLNNRPQIIAEDAEMIPIYDILIR